MLSRRGEHYPPQARSPPHERPPPAMATAAAPGSVTPRHPLPPISPAVKQETEIQIHHGRKYALFRRARYYLFPCDVTEMERLDVLHHILRQTRNNPLHSDVIQLEQRQNLLTLDLGAGSGIWVNRMGDQYPNGQTIGVDLHLFQEEKIPPNVSFALMDVEAPWRDIGDKLFDLIHVRQMLGSIHSWPSLYLKIFSNLKPQIGYLEQVEIDWTPRVDGGNPPPSNSRLQLWYDQLMRAMDDAGRPLRFDAGKIKEQLYNVGFADITEQVIQLPLHPWPTTTFEREMSSWTNLFLKKSMKSMTMLPLTKYLNWSPQQVIDLRRAAMTESQSDDYRWYIRVHIFNGRRP